MFVEPPAQGEGRGAENAETAEGRCGIAFGDGRGRTNCYFITGLTRVRAGGVASARTRRRAGRPQVLKESELREKIRRSLRVRSYLHRRSVYVTMSKGRIQAFYLFNLLYIWLQDRVVLLPYKSIQAHVPQDGEWLKRTRAAQPVKES